MNCRVAKTDEQQQQIRGRHKIHETGNETQTVKAAVVNLKTQKTVHGLNQKQKMHMVRKGRQAQSTENQKNGSGSMERRRY